MEFLIKIKKLLKKILPAPLFKRFHNFVRLRILPIFSKERRIIVAHTQRFIKKYGYCVISGPFKDMHYIDRATGSVLILKLIGCYEKVLHAPIEKRRIARYDTIIDIGCAEGYYLIGLGRMFPQAKLIGFDTEPDALEMTQELADANKIPNKLLLEGSCTSEKLSHMITNDTFLVCDAEGFEIDILDLKKTPSLANVKTIIVEAHDHAIPNATEILRERFAATHDIEILTYSTEEYDKSPFLSEIKDKNILAVLTNERGAANQNVLVMEKKSN